MANKLNDIIAYLVSHSLRKPLPLDLAMKLIYLADWLTVSRQGHPLTGCNWQFGYAGPECQEIIDAARQPDPRFYVVLTPGGVGREAPYAFQKSPILSIWAQFDLDQPSKEVLDEVIHLSESYPWPAFLRVLLSTYPLMMQPRFSDLNLLELAKREKDESPNMFIPMGMTHSQ